MTAPHFHTKAEAEGAISSIEHNSGGQGPGPSGKKAGPPTGAETGSQKNETAGIESELGKEL